MKLRKSVSSLEAKKKTTHKDYSQGIDCVTCIFKFCDLLTNEQQGKQNMIVILNGLCYVYFQVLISVDDFVEKKSNLKVILNGLFYNVYVYVYFQVFTIY